MSKESAKQRAAASIVDFHTKIRKYSKELLAAMEDHERIRFTQGGQNWEVLCVPESTYISFKATDVPQFTEETGWTQPVEQVQITKKRYLRFRIIA